MDNLIKLDKTQVKLAGDIFTKAFSNHPIFDCYFSDKRKKKKYLCYIFYFFVRYGLKYGEVYATSLNMEGIILISMKELSYL